MPNEEIYDGVILSWEGNVFIYAKKSIPVYMNYQGMLSYKEDFLETMLEDSEYAGYEERRKLILHLTSDGKYFDYDDLTVKELPNVETTDFVLVWNDYHWDLNIFCYFDAAEYYVFGIRYRIESKCIDGKYYEKVIPYKGNEQYLKCTDENKPFNR